MWVIDDAYLSGSTTCWWRVRCLWQYWSSADHAFIHGLLRLEGEQNFLNMLPLSHRQAIKSHWYRNSHLSLGEFINRKSLIGAPTGIEYHSDDPKQELYDNLNQVLAPVLN